MLSQGKGVNHINKTAWSFSYPLLENPITVRIHFQKTGKLQYISHLDLQRTFHRIIKRAGLPVWFTKGFNPHAKLVFSTPLSVGTQSVCEYLDLRMDRDVPCEILCERLRAEVTDELAILSVYKPQSKFSDIAYASYTYEMVTAGMGEELVSKMEQLFAAPELVMLKKTKSGEKEVNILPFIHSFAARFDGEKIIADAVLCASSDQFLNPEMLITAMRDRLFMFCGDPMQEWYSITRTDILRADLTSFR